MTAMGSWEPRVSRRIANRGLQVVVGCLIKDRCVGKIKALTDKPLH